ncbi:MAG: FG-GAP repeat protein [Bacteroidales bacterium]|nr:FG-GAP repeat protein [Bacteroidales bacterium]
MRKVLLFVIFLFFVEFGFSQIHTELQQITAFDQDAKDQYGLTVSYSGDFMIVGSWMDDNENGINAGSVYIYKYSVRSWVLEKNYGK